jgi:uncharacterized protein YqgC (DUF456 family)
MRQWHLDESIDRGFSDWFYIILALVAFFLISGKVYERYPITAPGIGVFIWGFAAYQTSQQYFVSFIAVTGFTILSILSIFVFLSDIKKRKKKD